MPAVTGTVLVATCATFQAQLNAAAALPLNLTHQVTLGPAGTTCTGPFFLPAHQGGTGWIIITGPNGAVQASGTRIGPADFASLPKLRYSGAGPNTAVSSSNHAQRYRFVGIEFINNPGFSPNYRLVCLGLLTDGCGGWNTGYFIFDHVVLHDTSTPHDTIRGIQGDTQVGNVAIMDSYCVGIGRAGANAQESQCWQADANPGPILFQNTMFQAAGENTMFCGGADPVVYFFDNGVSVAADTITLGGPASLYLQGTQVMVGVANAAVLPAPLVNTPNQNYFIDYVSTSNGVSVIKLATSLANANAHIDVNLTDVGQIAAGVPCAGGNCQFALWTPTMHPSDITIVRNDYVLPLEFQAVSGGGYVVKSLMELKCAQRILLEGNRFSGMDPQGGGNAWRLTPRNSTSGGQFLSISDLTARYNSITNSTNWINSIGSDDGTNCANGCISARSKRWDLHDNLVVVGGNPDLQGNAYGHFWTGQAGGIFAGCTDPNGSSPDHCQFSDIRVAHNTVDGIHSQFVAWYAPNATNLDIRDNLVNVNGFFGIENIQSFSQWGQPTLNTIWAATWIWTNNALAANSDNGGNANANYPQGSGNTYPATTAGFKWNADYTLQVGSTAHNAASDGTDQGVNWVAYNAAQSGSGGDIIPPSAPSNLVATGFSPTQINLTWTAATDNVGVTQYQLDRCTGLGCLNYGLIFTLSGGAVAFGDTTVACGTTYQYRLRAGDAVGNLGPYSTPASGTTLACSVAPSAPTGLRVQ